MQIPNSLSGLHTGNDSTVAPPYEWYRLVSQPKIAKKSIKPPILAFKVIKFGVNREPVYDFLLVINSNLGPISHHYWDTATYWPKIANFADPLSFNALVWGDPLRLYEKALQFLKLESSRQPTVKIWWSRLAPFLTDPPMWQMDRQTNRRTDKIAMAKTRWKQ